MGTRIGKHGGRVLLLDGIGDAAEDGRHVAHDEGRVDQQGGDELVAKAAASTRALVHGQADGDTGRDGEPRELQAHGGRGQIPEQRRDRRRGSHEKDRAPCVYRARPPPRDPASAVRTDEQAAHDEELGGDGLSAQAAPSRELAHRRFRLVVARMVVVCVHRVLACPWPSLPV